MAILDLVTWWTDEQAKKIIKVIMHNSLQIDLWGEVGSELTPNLWH